MPEPPGAAAKRVRAPAGHPRKKEPRGGGAPHFPVSRIAAQGNADGVEVKYALVADSRIGARGMNEDRVAHWRSGETLLMVVADGLGGHLHGEIAAQLAIDH